MEEKKYTYELTEGNIATLLGIIDRVQIPGRDADSIVTLKNTLRQPIIESRKNETKEKKD